MILLRSGYGDAGGLGTEEFADDLGGRVRSVYCFGHMFTSVPFQ